MKALILVDFENEWIDEGSDYYVGDISGVLDKTNSVIDHCRNNEYKIIFVRHIEEGSDNAFADNTRNTEIIADLHKEDFDIVITKNKISAFYQTSLEEELKGVEDVVVCGILTNLCVRSLVHDAYDRDYNITVVKDCCVSFDEQIQNFTFKDLKETREEIIFVNADAFIA